jgi:hypothetical protein
VSITRPSHNRESGFIGWLEALFSYNPRHIPGILISLFRRAPEPTRQEITDAAWWLD